MIDALPRELDSIEVRVLGCLMEKQLATPEYYPMTLNALVAACNQKSSREPVMELAEKEVFAALERLREYVLVWKITGGRAERWEHNLDAKLSLDAPEKAILTLLFLRGPQTSGELRTRSERLHDFKSLPEAEDTLKKLSRGPDALVCEVPRSPGQVVIRFMHLVSGPFRETPRAPAAVSLPAASGPPLSERVTALENRVRILEEALTDLKRKLGEA